ncbi:DUF4190 domain-containing protein [Cellulosimicrobium arenosum]|uniref:DUF4190 domain-containing protein n=1 Tax=Cellulosimicrobium arenosum TaxID=2708133 RepID=A0A927G9Z6_9MICO|nr:DUF4190 domain-containing protein [Cellulosimicrobium arenosum]MBD8079005.1 DUF4190 domain-containing protein [Cellulosimicrobium arenosum]
MSTPQQPGQPEDPQGQNPYGQSQPGPAGQPPQGGAPQYGAPGSYDAGQAPQAPQAPQYSSTPGYSAPQQDPGRTMGIVGLVLSFLGCLSIVGLILSIVALRKSKKAGYKNNLALAGIIVGSVVLVICIIVAIVIGIGTSAVLEKCAELGPGTHFEDGVTYTCS